MRTGKTSVDIYEYQMYGAVKEAQSEKDLAAVIDNGVRFSDHLPEKINKTNSIVGLIRRTFLSLDEEIFKSTHVTLV